MVSEGISEGDTVVVEGQLALANGMKVNPIPYHSATQSAQPEKELSARDGPEGSSAGETQNKAQAKETPAL